MEPNSHVGEGETQKLSNFGGIELINIAHDQDDSVSLRQLLDTSSYQRPGFCSFERNLWRRGLRSLLHPLRGALEVQSQLVEIGAEFVRTLLRAQASQRRIDHDSMEPG